MGFNGNSQVWAKRESMNQASVHTSVPLRALLNPLQLSICEIWHHMSYSVCRGTVTTAWPASATLSVCNDHKLWCREETDGRFKVTLFYSFFEMWTSVLLQFTVDRLCIWMNLYPRQANHYAYNCNSNELFLVSQIYYEPGDIRSCLLGCTDSIDIWICNTAGLFCDKNRSYFVSS